MFRNAVAKVVINKSVAVVRACVKAARHFVGGLLPEHLCLGLRWMHMYESRNTVFPSTASYQQLDWIGLIGKPSFAICPISRGSIRNRSSLPSA